jgi:steroid delta-isomerase-like uncharacterized protein
MTDPISIANRWIAAYNAKDLVTLRSLMTDDIHVEHHNRNAIIDGAETLISVMKQFGELAPDRRFHSIRKQTTDGRTVVTELTWELIPTVDLPGFGKKGETLRLDLACIWTLRDGRVFDYHDYG